MQQPLLFPGSDPLDQSMPPRAKSFPQLRYMGSKFRLMPWIFEVLSEIGFESAIDAFSGSGCVSYLLKSMGKTVISNDFLNFPFQIARATIENSKCNSAPRTAIYFLPKASPEKPSLKPHSPIFSTLQANFVFSIRFGPIWTGCRTAAHRSIALAALARACVKRQPRGVFTVRGTGAGYDDGRRDLKIKLGDQFVECVDAYNQVIFDNGRRCRAMREDVLTGKLPKVDLVYLDPPYVPRSDDNCYIKRYHFLEGLMSYWRDADTTIMAESVVKKIEKRFTTVFLSKHSLGRLRFSF